eukprot:Amastigsp_a677559_27.p5 type:complete len:132 gc:universal Amastigsp_a677559_27:1260-1655(+)
MLPQPWRAPPLDGDLRHDHFHHRHHHHGRADVCGAHKGRGPRPAQRQLALPRDSALLQDLLRAFLVPLCVLRNAGDGQAAHALAADRVQRAWAHGSVRQAQARARARRRVRVVRPEGASQASRPRGRRRRR